MRQVPEAIKAKARLAHEAIHNPSATYAEIDNQAYPITKHRNGCRMVKIGTYVVMEQNKLKNTEYGRRARAGEHLSWIIPSDPNVSWYLIEG